MEQKIDIHNSDFNYEKALAKLEGETDISKHNKELIKEFLEDAAIGKTARKNTRKKEMGVRARLKALYLLKIAAKGLQKDFDKLVVKDMEKFIKEINTNKITKSFHNVKSNNYSGETKANMKKMLIHFLKWLYKDNKKFYELTGWIETITPKSEIPALDEKDIIKMMDSCNTIKQKFLIGFLFNCGCRIEEFLNIRISDLTLVNDNPKYYNVTLREQFSKTKGRTVPLNWKNMTPLIQQWLALHENRDDMSAPLYPSTYDGARVILEKIGKRSLNKHVNPHLLRHSSATYDANKLNRYQLCYKFGWSFSSAQPDRYIDRAKINTKEIAGHYQRELQEDILGKLAVIEEQNKSLRDSDKLFAEKMIQLLEILKNNKLAAKLMSREDKEKLMQLFN